MASLRYAAQCVLDECREGIAWVVVWKEGRGWETSRFYLEYNERSNTVRLDWPEDLETLQGILAIDQSAIIVNSYVHNLGVFDGQCTRDDLAGALRWQYELQHATLADFMELIV